MPVRAYAQDRFVDCCRQKAQLPRQEFNGFNVRSEETLMETARTLPDPEAKVGGSAARCGGGPN